MTGTRVNRVLIANRGEIAVRIIRACHESGRTAVACYGPGEENAPHVRLADDAWRLPSDHPRPYLDIPAVLEVARRAGADAVHPGYGFLSENADFAAACEDAGLVFIGPTPDAIRAMGDKLSARVLAREAGAPVTPGTMEPVESPEAAESIAAELGYPVAVKAAGGGGGRGFRVARSAAELPEAFAGASGEAARWFGNPVVYLERFLDRPRHVEIQLMADSHGEVVILGERDCSLQRRRQKLVEETPAPGLPPATRAAMAEASRSLAQRVGYRGAGTVEFLLAADGSFYFLEMNTRIQVEHPVTEMVTGFDLVREQLRIADGEPMSFHQTDVAPRGHAIECRINAEDPARGFAPAPGVITAYSAPAGFGVRVDSAAEAGTTILPDYDSMIAKLITWDVDRDSAIARMRRALTDFRIAGLPTTIPFDLNVMNHPEFIAGDLAITFVDEHPELIPAAEPAAVASAPDTNGADARELIAEVNGRRFAVRLSGLPEPVAAPVNGNRAASGRRAPSVPRAQAAAASGDGLPSPIQGTLLRLLVETGQTVEPGQAVAVVEAMKMENEVTAHRAGTVEALPLAPGAAVKIGDILARIV